jgi:hypothetical protein
MWLRFVPAMSPRTNATVGVAVLRSRRDGRLGTSGGAGAGAEARDAPRNVGGGHAAVAVALQGKNGVQVWDCAAAGWELTGSLFSTLSCPRERVGVRERGRKLGTSRRTSGEAERPLLWLWPWL